MILVTGAAGFIGSHVANELALGGYQIAMCDVKPSFKDAAYWMEKYPNAITAVFHLGAISDTTCEDVVALCLNNTLLTARLWSFCADKGIPFIYASSAAVYGNGDGPLNLYAKSKLDFDRLAETAEHTPPNWYGLRFYNVYGDGEAHKGKQASMVHQLAEQSKAGYCEIFQPKSRRDFVHVDDVVSVMLWLWKNRPASGIYDVGTGKPRSFYELAEMFDADTRVIPFPESLIGKYQHNTRADLTKLRAAGYDRPFLSLEEGVARMLSA